MPDRLPIVDSGVPGHARRDRDRGGDVPVRFELFFRKRRLIALEMRLAELKERVDDAYWVMEEACRIAGIPIPAGIRQARQDAANSLPQGEKIRPVGERPPLRAVR